MFKEKTTEEIINLINHTETEQNLEVNTDNLNITIKNDELTVKTKKKENYTLEDLVQKSIDYLCNKFEQNLIINEVDVELFKTLKKD